MNLRFLAARILKDVTQGRSLSHILTNALSNIKDARDRAFVQALVYGTCRYYTRLDFCLSHLLKKPMREKDNDIHALLMIGLFQLMEMNIPQHAAVSETVNALVDFKKPWARGLVNAVLREYLRKASSLKELIENDPEALFAHPKWWIDAIKNAWPQQWQDILRANNEHPPFSLRINQQKITREDYLKKLQTITPDARIIEETEYGIILKSPISLEHLVGFSDGEISVQDGAAQLAASLLNLTPGLRILDVCAAPGGKLTHLLEKEPNLLEVIAIEKNSERILLIQQNLARLQTATKVTCICEDAKEVSNWWDGQLVDRILLDVPCSASGVIRRHPDIKLLRLQQDLKELAQEQSQLLKAMWPLLKTGGVLLYATCSIFPQENVDVIRDFLSNQSNAKEDKIMTKWGIACEFGRQILPGMHQMDGFYYARIQKI